MLTDGLLKLCYLPSIHHATNNCILWLKMISRLFRFIKRFAILLPGLIVVYVSINGIFPIFDKHIPDVPAFIITYIIAAYFLVPLLLRLIRILIKPQHIPLYSTTPDGFACDPVNIGVIGTKEQLEDVMKAAGWHKADRRSLHTLGKMLTSILFRQPYNNAPFSNLYLLGRPQDVGFELPLGNSILNRHHVRFWAASQPATDDQHEHEYFWRRHYRPRSAERLLWVGAASLDNGIGIIGHNAQLTHDIHHDTNAERDFLVGQLKPTGKVKRTRSITIGSPYRLRNRVISRYLHADGKLTICEL